MASPYDDLTRPPLDQSVLRRALLSDRTRWTQLDVVAESASTNATLVAAADEPDVVGRVLIAEHQTAGRGRLARTWTSPPRSGLTMSVAVRPEGVDAVLWPWLPLLTGLAVAAAVRTEARIDVSLKWPNDVVVDDRKLAGILVERVETRSGPLAVVGIGLNVAMTADERPVPTATSVALEGATADRSVLARAVLRALDGLLRQWESVAGDPDAGLRTAYVEACSTVERDVRVELPAGETVVGRAVGIDANGRLLVRTALGECAVGAGDVLHLRDST